MAFETIILLILMVSIVLKANIFSVIYLIFILRYVTSKAKTHLLVRMAMYVSVCLACQYFLFMLNLTAQTSPAPFPAQFAGYPRHEGAPVDLSIKYAIPVFFHYQVFHDLKLGYLIGIGIGQGQVQNLILDFINLYLVSMYVFHYRNPILIKAMRKVFWVFPTPGDAQDRWHRLEPEVKKQVKWLISPVKLSSAGQAANKKDPGPNGALSKLLLRQELDKAQSDELFDYLQLDLGEEATAKDKDLAVR